MAKCNQLTSLPFKVKFGSRVVCHFDRLTVPLKASRSIGLPVRGVGSWNHAGEAIPLHVKTTYQWRRGKRACGEGQRLQSHAYRKCNAEPNWFVVVKKLTIKVL